MKVWVTRDEASDGPLSTALRKHGLTAVTEPVLKRQVVPGAAEILKRLGRDDWLVLTSPYAIRAAATCDAARIPRVAVVGEASRQVAEALGMRVELVADGNADSLFARLREIANTGHICYARSSNAAARPGWAAVELTCPVLYETSARAFDRSVIMRVDLAVVASPSAVRAIGPVDLPLASIGPTTSSAIRELGCQPCVEAGRPTFDALAQAIAAQQGDSRHQRA